MIFNEENKIGGTWFDPSRTGWIGKRMVRVISEVEQVIILRWKIINTDILFFRITCTNKSFTIRPI